MPKFYIEISDRSLELLKRINAEGYAEFRDSRYDSFEEFEIMERAADPFCKINKEGFYARNFCDFCELEELIKYNLIDSDGESWHLTYKVTELGKNCLKQLL